MYLPIWVNDSNLLWAISPDRKQRGVQQLDYLEKLISSQGDPITIHLQILEHCPHVECMNMYRSLGCL